jgi:hypothetical protein
MCISTDCPHFDANFFHVADNLLKNIPRELAAQVLLGRAHLCGFTKADFQRAEAQEASAAASRTTESWVTADIVSFVPLIIAMRWWDFGRQVSRKELDRDLVRVMLQVLGFTVANGNGDSGGR